MRPPSYGWPVSQVRSWGVATASGAGLACVCVLTGVAASPGWWPAVALLAIAFRVGAVETGRALAGSAGPALVAAVFGMFAAPLALRDVLQSRASEAHGDGVEPVQVSLAALVVLVVVGGSAVFVTNRRRSTT